MSSSDITKNSIENIAASLARYEFDIVKTFYLNARNNFSLQLIKRIELDTGFSKGFVVGIERPSGFVRFVSDSDLGDELAIQQYIKSGEEDRSRLDGFFKHFLKHLSNSKE